MWDTYILPCRILLFIIFTTPESTSFGTVFAASASLNFLHSLRCPPFFQCGSCDKVKISIVPSPHNGAMWKQGTPVTFELVYAMFALL